MLSLNLMDNLSNILKVFTGTKRSFILMRIAGLDTDLSMKLTGVSRGTYNSWFKNEEFATVYHQIESLIANHRDDAIQLLRRNNQLEAVLLESKMISKIKDEIEAGHYDFTRTHLAREVYSKLMSELDKAPASIKRLSWEQRIQQFLPGEQRQISRGVIIDGEFEEVSEQSSEHSQSKPTQEGEQTPI